MCFHGLRKRFQFCTSRQHSHMAVLFSGAALDPGVLMGARDGPRGARNLALCQHAWKTISRWPGLRHCAGGAGELRPMHARVCGGKQEILWSGLQSQTAPTLNTIPRCCRHKGEPWAQCASYSRPPPARARKFSTPLSRLWRSSCFISPPASSRL